MVTKDEFKILIKALKAAFADPKFLPDTAAYDIWYEMLKNFSYKVLSEAVYAYLQTESKIPTIADIRNKALELTGEVSLSGEEAWALVYKALCNSSYNSVEEFAKLPYPVQKAVGSSQNLQNWAVVENNDVETVIHSQFLKAYAVEKNRYETIKTSPDRFAKIDIKPVEFMIEDKIETEHEEKPTIDVDSIVAAVISKLKEEK